MPSVRFRSTALVATLAPALLLAGCVTDPETGQKRMSNTAIGAIGGALGGYVLGDIVGGRRDRSEKILGAGIGAVAGAGIGYYLDQQEKELRQKTAGTGVEVTRDGDSLMVNMPSQVTFAVGSATIEPDFRDTLNSVADTLARYERSYIDIYGHTDSTGSDEFNQTLSERRARSVADYLSTRGVQYARMETRGFGESQPIASNTTEEGRAANRRVEIRIVPVREEDLAQR